MDRILRRYCHFLSIHSTNIIKNVPWPSFWKSSVWGVFETLKCRCLVSNWTYGMGFRVEFLEVERNKIVTHLHAYSGTLGHAHKWDHLERKKVEWEGRAWDLSLRNSDRFFLVRERSVHWKRRWKRLVRELGGKLRKTVVYWSKEKCFSKEEVQYRLEAWEIRTCVYMAFVWSY